MTAGLVRAERREAAPTQRHGEELWHLSEQQGFRFFAAQGLSLAGHGAFLGGDTGGGLTRMRQGVELYRAAGQRVGLRLRTLFAEMLTEVGEVDEALAIADALLAHADATGEGGSLSEVYRVRGQALWRRGSPGADVEVALARAVELAVAQEARLLALRALTGLVRFQSAHAAASPAVERLRAVHGQFTEGLDVADVAAARTLVTASPG
jgi:hypothetical protein